MSEIVDRNKGYNITSSIANNNFFFPNIHKTLLCLFVPVKPKMLSPSQRILSFPDKLTFFFKASRIGEAFLKISRFFANPSTNDLTLWRLAWLQKHNGCIYYVRQLILRFD